MEETVLFAALAGLLHDIGKFSQRAGVGLSEVWDASAQAQFGYQHALGSYQFTRQVVPEAWRKPLSGVAYHHRPQNPWDYWVQLADHLSAAERDMDKEDEAIPHMQSIFSAMGGYTAHQYLPLKRLNPARKESLFATEFSGQVDKEKIKRDYLPLWSAFEQECKTQLASQSSLKSFLEMLFALMQEFTWSIPSSYWNSVADISLYDHSRTTAAIAACLAADKRNPDWCQKAKTSQEPVCLLVGGDLSGLQAFIYSIASSGAAKSLRARSFYIQMMSDAIAMDLLEWLGLPLTNLLYSGGGGFQILAPIRAGEKLLEEAAQVINDRLLLLHQGALGLTLKWVPVNALDFSNFKDTRDRLGKEINHAKRQPFASASSELLSNIIGQPLNLGGDPLRYCSVTGEDGPTIVEDKNEPGTYKSKFVLSLEALGNQLPRASHLVLSRVAPVPASLATDWRVAIQCFGMDVQVAGGSNKIDRPPESKDGFLRLWRLDGEVSKDEPALRQSCGQPVVPGYRPFAHLTPLDKYGHPLTFDDLAHPISGNFKRWGVLRMDVDNLGSVFRNGMGDKSSLSRYASLSYALRLFFEGWLPQLAGPDLQDYLYLQYSGGDDIFIVGAWDALTQFALRVAHSFAEYTAGNPLFSISAGIAIVDERFPLYLAARMAGEAEDDAKGFVHPDGRQKAAVTFLDNTLGWQDFQVAQDKAYRLAGLINDRLLPHSLLQTLLRLHQQIIASQTVNPANGKKSYQLGRWTWMAAYQLTRVILTLKNDEAKAEVGLLLKKFIFPDDETEILGLAARWAQYLTRGG